MIGKNILAILVLAPLLFLKPAPLPAAEQPETVCIQCHGSMPERLGAPVNKWRGSIHAENGISCNGCHGGDPKDAANAMSPQRGFLGVPKEKEIPGFCGRCHPGVYKDYLASAHGRALGAGGPTCVTCHGSHQVVKASLALINEKSCTRCHSFDRARAIRDAMSETEGRIEGISARIAQFQVSGVDTEKMGKALFSVRNRFHTLFHDVDVNRVKRESAAINRELGKLDAALKEIEDSHARRRVAGGIAVAAALVLAILFHLLKKSYD